VADQEYQLVVRKGPEPGAIYPLTAESIVLGRAPTNEIILEDSEVSRQHARLTMKAEGYELQDLGSTNGTFLDGRRISGVPVLLHSGQVIMLGTNVSLLYEVLAAVDPLATVVAFEPAIRAAEEEPEPEPEPPPAEPEPVAPPVEPEEVELPAPPTREPAIRPIEEEPPEEEPEAVEEAAPVEEPRVLPTPVEAAQLAALEELEGLEEEPDTATILEMPAQPPPPVMEPEPSVAAPVEPEPAPEEEAAPWEETALDFPPPTPLPSFPETELEAPEPRPRAVFDSGAPMAEFEAGPPEEQVPPGEPTKKRPSRTIIIVLVALLVCCCLTVIAAVLFFAISDYQLDLGLTVLGPWLPLLGHLLAVA
jgi:pSer/pThr/pTyr-binding forkhead associated (FHA) protein